VPRGGGRTLGTGRRGTTQQSRKVRAESTLDLSVITAHAYRSHGRAWPKHSPLMHVPAAGAGGADGAGAGAGAGGAGAGGAGGAGGGVLRGGVSKLRRKRALLLLPPHMARRRAQVGVVTGLASRRPTSLQRGFYPANRTAYAQVMCGCVWLQMSTLNVQQWHAPRLM